MHATHPHGEGEPPVVHAPVRLALLQGSSMRASRPCISGSSSFKSSSSTLTWRVEESSCGKAVWLVMPASKGLACAGWGRAVRTLKKTVGKGSGISSLSRRAKPRRRPRKMK